MVRVTLVLFLSLGSAVGPSLCCCATGSLLASDPLAGGRRGCEPHQCCGSHGENSDLPRSSSGPAPHQSCPCQESPPVAWAPVISTVSDDGSGRVPVFSLPFESVASLTASLPLAAEAVVGIPGSPGAFRGRDGRAILASLHIVRC
jgi:hypothetical protein